MVRRTSTWITTGVVASSFERLPVSRELMTRQVMSDVEGALEARSVELSCLHPWKVVAYWVQHENKQGVACDSWSTRATTEALREGLESRRHASPSKPDLEI